MEITENTPKIILWLTHPAAVVGYYILIVLISAVILNKINQSSISDTFLLFIYTIPFGLTFLIDKYWPKFAFLVILAPPVIVGFIFNIVFSSRRAQHLRRAAKDLVAERIYDGFVIILPNVEEINKKKSSLYFNSPDPLFWPIPLFIVFLFLLFTFHPFFKNRKNSI